MHDLPMGSGSFQVAAPLALDANQTIGGGLYVVPNDTHGAEKQREAGRYQPIWDCLVQIRTPSLCHVPEGPRVRKCLGVVWQGCCLLELPWP